MVTNAPGLVLTGGGARGAYQAGVLKAVADATRDFRPPGKIPFSFLSGTSAGALNVSFLASHPEDFDGATQGLWDLWAGITTDKVVDTRGPQLTMLGLKWLKDLSTGGLLGESSSNFLLDTWPLRKLLESTVRPAEIARALATGLLQGVAVTSTHYATGTTVVFHAGKGEDWSRTTRMARVVPLNVSHVMASAAIPFLFPPVLCEGSLYGDGGIRDASPLSPVIHMGADRVMAVGIRYRRTAKEVHEMNLTRIIQRAALADIAGVMLNSVFLDGLEADHERLERINNTVRSLLARGATPEEVPLKDVPAMVMQPSQDLGAMAASHFKSFPFVLRRLLRGIGASNDRGSDLLSYLSFDGAYTLPLLKLGYQDGMAQADALCSFLMAPRG